MRQWHLGLASIATLGKGCGAKLEIVWSYMHTIHMWAVAAITIIETHPAVCGVPAFFVAVEGVFKA